MKISSNVTKPKPKRKTTTIVGLKTEPAQQSVSSPTVTPAKSTYKKEDVRTGDKRYGKESSTKPTPQFIKKAQSAGADVIQKNGKDFRAGTTTTTPTKIQAGVAKLPDKVKAKLVIKSNVSANQTKKSSGKKIKLKPMAMTYGTDSHRGGGTVHRNKVRPR